MIQCKIFSGSVINEIELKVNTFLRDHANYIINSIHQAANNEFLFISIFYQMKSKSLKIKEAAIEEINVPITIPLVE